VTKSFVLGEADHSVELVAAGGDAAIQMPLVTGQRVDAGQLFAGYESLYPARRDGAMY